VIKRLFLGVLALGLPCTLGRAAPTTGPSTSLRQISPDECKQELDRLRMVVEACAQELQQPKTAPKACDPSLGGPDEIVLIGSGERRLQYDWLRDSLRQAAAAESAKHEQSVVSNASSRLSDAHARLEQMTQELASPPASVYVPVNIANIRRQLDAILKSGDYPQAKPPSYLERIWNDFVRWLLRSIVEAMPTSSSSTIYLLELTVIAIPCGLLIWWFIRRLQVQRLGLPQDSVRQPSTPSALDWQEWLEQGQKLGREGLWREAIHHVYWAAIACLESRRLWPADRTRTPREYLGLLSENPETRADLFSLTKTFEQSWYGELPPGEKDFTEACGTLERIAAR
jgi:hypothetical protein